MAEKEVSFVDENRFYILGEFGDDLNKNIVVPMTKKIDELSRYRDPTMDVYINSPGGNGFILMHIVELFEHAKSRGIIVRTIIPAYAFSAGSMLAIAGTPGERYMGRTAEHLIHYGSVSGWYEFTPTQVDRNSAWKKRWFQQLVEHYKKYSNVPKLEERIKDDSYFIPADKCIRWGLADKYMEDMAVKQPFPTSGDDKKVSVEVK